MTEQASDPLELTCGCQPPGMGDGCLEANSGPVQEHLYSLDHGDISSALLLDSFCKKAKGNGMKRWLSLQEHLHSSESTNSI